MSKIIDVNYSDEMKSSYIDYSMSVITSRALPDVRDGLKPVHRRILFAMRELNNTHDKPHKKSARIVGDVLGKYHPHGDLSVYDAMVRLAQDFKTNHTFVDGHGNFGSIDGDGAAAMRYTEARLSPIAQEMLRDMNKESVNFKENFDQSLKEPEVLPAKFCNLLVNGSEGIAVGMATAIPPHNLREINNACKLYLENNNVTHKGIMGAIKGPDFPTGGIIANKDEIDEIYEKGNGRIRVRAKMEIEDAGYGKSNIVITEIPYSFSGNKTRLIESLIDKIQNKELNELVDVRDESDREGLRIVLETKKGINPEKLINKLYATTRLEDTIRINFLALVDGKPKNLNIKEVIKEYVEFSKITYKRAIEFDLNNLEKDREIYEGLIKAVDVIDLIIEIIRNSNNREDVFKCLTTGEINNINLKTKKSQNEASKLSFTKNQADAILKLQLQRLVGLEVNKIKKELKETMETIKKCKLLLSSDKELSNLMINELDDMKSRYGKNRITKIEEIEEAEYEEEIVVEDLYVLIDRFNYVKIIDENSYSRSNIDGYRECMVRSNDSIHIWTSKGIAIQLRMEDMPIMKMSDRGEALDNNMEIFTFASGEDIDDKLILFITKEGYLKLVEGKEFETNRRELIATKIRDEDELIDVCIVDKDIKYVELFTNKKRKEKVEIKDVPVQGRNTIGSRRIDLKDKEYLIKAKVSK